MDEDELAAEVRALRDAVESLESRVERLEREADVERADPSAEATAVEEGAVGDPATDDSDLEDPEPDAPPDEESVLDVGSSAADEDGDADDGDGLLAIGESEFVVGVKWLGIAGAAALIAASAFFVQLAIERGYLGPLGRVLLGVGVGAALFVGGRYAARERGLDRWGRIVAGTGFVVAYFALYASYAFEGYREAIGHPLWLSLLAMTALVAATVAASIRDRDAAVAGEAVLFGYATAALATGDFGPLVVPAYVVGLTLALAAVAAVRPWRRVLAAGALSAYLVLAWWSNATDGLSQGVEFAAVAATFAVVLAGTELVRRADPPLEDGATTATAVLAGVNGLAVITYLSFLFIDEPIPGSLSLGAVAVLFLASYLVATTVRDRAADAEPFLAILAFAAAFNRLAGDALQIGVLAVVALAAVLASRRLPDRRLGEAGLVAAAVLFVDALVAVYGWWFLSDPTVESVAGRAALVAVLGGVYYAVFALDERGDEPGIAGLEFETLPVAATFGWGGAIMAVVCCSVLLDGVALSAAWAVVGLASIAAGVGLDVSDLRYHGMAVLAVTTAKVFIFDTASLDPVPRILSFVVLGVVLLVASLVYAKTQADVDVPVLGDAFGR